MMVDFEVLRGHYTKTMKLIKTHNSLREQSQSVSNPARKLQAEAAASSLLSLLPVAGCISLLLN